MIQIDKNNCDVCGTCISICPENALALTDTLSVNHVTCTECQKCVALCPFGALRKEEREPQETSVD